MIQRQDYIDGEVSHREYYAQFVNTQILNLALRIGKSRLIASSDSHFNDIPLNEWDRLSREFIFTGLDEQLRSCGDYLTMAGRVCILKEAARQIVENQ